MKCIKYFSAVLLIMGLFTTSCSDDLVLKPLGEYSETDVWKDPALAELFANGIYDAMDIPYAKYMQMCFVDEGHRRDNSDVTNFNNCILSPDNIPGWTKGEGHPRMIWDQLYGVVRKCNILLAGIENLPDDNTLVDGQTKKNRLKGEGYFLRAWTYLYLTNLYGGVPIVDKVYQLGDDYRIARNTYEECIKFITDDCDKAAGLLPNIHSGSNNGRATKGAALALKSRILLYAASDLHNTFNFSGYSKPEYLKYTSGNQADRWKAAKNAAKAVIDMNLYALYKGSPASTDSIAENISELFLAPKATEEDIFIRYFTSRLVPYNNNILNNNTPNGYHGGGNNCPIGELVDDYEMRSGIPFSWENPEHAATPYKNRDPRFYASILYEGAKWRTRTADVIGIEPNGIISIGNKEIWDSKKNEMQLWYGPDGRNSTVSAFEGGYTGYYIRKFMDPTKDGQYQDIAQDTPWRHIRYAEILLNYAEACIELGEFEEARPYINQVRKRAGMPAVTATGDELKECCRHERRIELAFEDSRMWDVRRWAIGPNVYKPIHGVTILYKMDPATHITSDAPLITPYEFEKRAWLDKAYFFPIPRSEMNKNELLIQNPGYE